MNLILTNVSRVLPSVKHKVLLADFGHLIPWFVVFRVLFDSGPAYPFDRVRQSSRLQKSGLLPGLAGCLAVFNAPVVGLRPEGAHRLKRQDAHCPQVD
jgi:hypothetical protein